MPIVNGAYEAPTWNNDAPPAINAAELQDICDTIETYNTTKADVSYVNTFVRPNLLDNADFVGGGSQQGGGQFPINQRGQTSYKLTSNYLGYAIDRWILRDNFQNGQGISLQSDGLSVNFSGTNIQGISQAIENPSKLLGKKVTFSVLFGSRTGRMWIGLWWSSTAGLQTTAIQTLEVSSALPSVTATLPASIPSGSSYLNVSIMTYAGHTPTANILAAKLELGDTQTLAHQENGVWVLNAIPNYEVELAKCLRTVVPLGNFERIRASRVVGSVINFFVPTPVSMRGAGTMTLIPSLSDTNNIIKIYDMNNNQLTGFTFSAAACSSNGVTIAASKTNHGITDAYIQFESNTYNAFLVNDL